MFFPKNPQIYNIYTINVSILLKITFIVKLEFKALLAKVGLESY